MITFKNTHKMFHVDATEIIKTYIGTDYFSCIEPKKETIIVEPTENQIKY